MSSLVERVEGIISPVLESMGYGVVRVMYAKVKRGRLQVMIERLDGENISMDDCVAASREISVTLDVEDPIEDAYTLEVTSPGLDRPLVKPEHYTRFVGEKVEVHLFAPKEGRRKFQGLLTQADDKGCTVRVGEKDNVQDISFAYAEITRANLVPAY